MKTPEQLARRIQIMTGIRGTTIEEAYDYVMMVEVRNEYSQLADIEFEKEKMLRTLGGIQGIDDAGRWYLIRKTIMLNQGVVL